MAVETIPCFLQDEAYSAEALRHVFGTLLARGANIGSIAGGLVGATDMQVTAGSGMQVLVATGEAWIPGTSVSTQGGYLGRVTSSTALAISASSESNPRIETIIAQIQDKAVAGGTDSFSVSVVVGTATSGATLANKLGAGSVPASSLVLAYVLVPSKAVSIVSGDIENVAIPMGVPIARSGVYTTMTPTNFDKYLISATQTAFVVFEAFTENVNDCVSADVKVGSRTLESTSGTGKENISKTGTQDPKSSIGFMVPRGIEWEPRAASIEASTLFLTADILLL